MVKWFIFVTLDKFKIKRYKHQYKDEILETQREYEELIDAGEIKNRFDMLIQYGFLGASFIYLLYSFYIYSIFMF